MSRNNSRGGAEVASKVDATQGRIDALTVLKSHATRLQRSSEKLKTGAQRANAKRTANPGSEAQAEFAKTAKVLEKFANDFVTTAARLRQRAKQRGLKPLYRWEFMVNHPSQGDEAVVPEIHTTIDGAKRFLGSGKENPVQMVQLIIIPALEYIFGDMGTLSKAAEQEISREKRINDLTALIEDASKLDKAASNLETSAQKANRERGATPSREALSAFEKTAKELEKTAKELETAARNLVGISTKLGCTVYSWKYMIYDPEPSAKPVEMVQEVPRADTIDSAKDALGADRNDSVKIVELIILTVLEYIQDQMMFLTRRARLEIAAAERAKCLPAATDARRKSAESEIRNSRDSRSTSSDRGRSSSRDR